MNKHTHTDDGDLLAELSPRARALLERMNEARAECRKLHQERVVIEERLMEAMARASEAQSAYYTCLSVDESQAAELKRREMARAMAAVDATYDQDYMERSRGK